MTELQKYFAELDLPAEEDHLEKPATAMLKKGGGRALKSGGQWIYDNEIDRVEGSLFQDGDIIAVHDFDGYPLGYGFINSHSKIRVRMLARYEREGITASFLRRRVEDAWNYRKMVSDTDSCRLIFGEADFLPGLTVDKFEDVLVVECLALGMEKLKLLILRDLVETLGQDGIKIRGIYERSDAKVRKLEGMELFDGFIGPEFDTKVAITENGVKYLVDVQDGQKTGFFLDQKKNRAAVADIVRRMASDMRRKADHSGTRAELGTERGENGPSVLDCFTHTGSFGLNCALAGASDVLSVDASELAIRQAMENARLNGFEPELVNAGGDGRMNMTADDPAPSVSKAGSKPGAAAADVQEDKKADAPGALAADGESGGASCRIRYQAADVFELLPKLEEEGKRFDVVILDPPAFTKSRQATKNAVRGYREINLRGMKLVRDGGILATCSCSHFMDPELLEKTIKEAAHGAHRRLQQIEFRTQGPDHPILWGDDESYYLKFCLFRVMPER